MPDTAAQRANMVVTQLLTNDVTDARVRHGMATIPREMFVPETLKAIAYTECSIPLKAGRVLLEPRTFAKLAQLATIGPDDRVLDIGCGTGYSTAVLSLVGGRVFGLEELPELAGRAEENLRALGISNAEIIRGRLPDGCAKEAPFDVIVINGAVEEEPAHLIEQLNDGGRLVTITRSGAAAQGRLYMKHQGAIGDRSAFDAQAPVLPGFEKPRSFVF